MKLLNAFDELLNRLEPCFGRIETFERAKELGFSQVATLGRRNISRIICTKNQPDEDWSADYKFFSCRKWSPEMIFNDILEQCDTHSHWYNNAIIMAMDDTNRQKTGKKIPCVRTLRDPMSPPFHTNLIQGIRFLQVSMIINPEGNIELSRAIPCRFIEAAPAKKPKKNAPDEIKEQFKKDQKQRRISAIAADELKKIRKQIDQLPNGKNRTLIITVDGGFCNRTFLRDQPQGVVSVARGRKDLNICQPAATNGRKIYGERLPTPEEIRQDDQNFPWKTAQVFAAGKSHNVRYKVVSPVLWQKGTGQLPCRLLVIAPLRYRKKKNSKLLYRDPAYLVVTDLTLPDAVVLQAYFSRWDIEVNHRDEKSLMGLADAQVRSEKSVERNPQFTVMMYSLMLLASIKAYGPSRTEDYLPVPKWYKRKEKNNKRPSTLDIISQFRREIINEQFKQYMQLNLKTQQKSKYRRKKPKSRIEARKRGFVDNSASETKPLKLPVDILSALLYADC
jgi:hypothetical protein